MAHPCFLGDEDEHDRSVQTARTWQKESVTMPIAKTQAESLQNVAMARMRCREPLQRLGPRWIMIVMVRSRKRLLLVAALVVVFAVLALSALWWITTDNPIGP